MAANLHKKSVCKPVKMKNLMPYPRMCCFCKDMTLGFRGPSIAFAVDFQSTCLYCDFSAPSADGAVLGVEHTELAWGDALNFL